MKLNEFVNMVKSCSLLKEESQTVKCYGQLGHDKSFEELISLIQAYAGENNLGTESLDISNMTGDTCSVELFELIKKVQTHLNLKPDGIAGKNTLAALEGGKPLAKTTTQKPIEPTDKDRVIIIGDSNASFMARKWYGRGKNLPSAGRVEGVYYLLDGDELVAPQISSGQIRHIRDATKEFFQLKGDNYKPSAAIIHMGYNGPTDHSAFRDTISFLKSKGVSDIRVIELKVDPTKRAQLAKKAGELNRFLRGIPGIKIISNDATNATDGYHFVNPQVFYAAAMSGTPAPKETNNKKQVAVASSEKGFPGFISKKSTGSTIRILSPFGSFNEAMGSVTKIFKAAAAKSNLQVSENPTIDDLKNLQSKLGLDDDGDFGPTSMAAISLINSKYAKGVVSEDTTAAINLKSHLSTPFRGLIEESLNNLLKESTLFGTIDVDLYVDEYAASSALSRAYKGIESKGMKITKPPMKNKYAKKDTSWREDKEFLRKVKIYSKENGVNPKMFLAFMAHETAGTFSPYMTNHIGCVGLIQFCPGSRAGMATIGKSGSQLRQMTRSEQWDQVERFYDANKNYNWNKDGGDISMLYMITFSPRFSTLGPDDVIYSEDPTAAHPKVRNSTSDKLIKVRWKGNPANHDPRNKSVITKKGLEMNLNKMYKKYNITDQLFEV